MDKKVSYAIVGLFVLVLGGAWLVISLWLALGDFSEQYTPYRVYMRESVSGLYRDAPVKYRGVEIGKVSEIALDPKVPEQVRLTLNIDSTVPIKEDTIAVLTVQGLTGIAFVDLTGGSLAAPLLEAKPGVDYPVIPSGQSFFARLDTSATELIGNVNDLAYTLGKLLDAQGRQALRDILINVERITRAFANRQAELEQSIASAARMFDHGARATEELPSLLVQARETAENFAVMAGKVSETSDSINQYVDRSGLGIQQFSEQTLPELGVLVSELRRLADILTGMGQTLGEDPRILLYGPELAAPGPGE